MRTDLSFDPGRAAGTGPGMWAGGFLPGGLLLAGLLATAQLGVAQAPAAPAAPAPPIAPMALAMLQATDQDRILTGDHTVDAGESVEDIVVVGGTLRVRGEVKGKAVVVGGNLVVEEDGSILGDALVTGGRIINEGGRILGEMRMTDDDDHDVSEEIREAIVTGEVDIRREVEREVEDEVRRTVRVEVDGDRGRGGWGRSIGRGFASLISTLSLGLLLAGIGSALIFYGRSYLDNVSDTLRANTMRSMGVGLAAGFLVVPAFVVMVVALAVSIIGIPVLIVAVPGYILAIPAALAFGLLAVAHAVGERTAEQSSDRFELRHRNAYSYLFTGLGMMLAPLLAASLLQMTGFLGFLGTILKVLTVLGLWVAATAGLGAVILSRAGTRRTFAAPPRVADYDSDPIFDPDFTARGPHV